MPKVSTYTLADGRTLSLCIFEVDSFPNLPVQSDKREGSFRLPYNSFLELINEVYRLSGDNVCLEFFWVSEKVDNQLFKSKIRIFCVLRKIVSSIGNNEIEVIANSLKGSFSEMNFGIKELDSASDDFKTLLNKIDTRNIYSVVKNEQCIHNINSVYPYYFTDIIPFPTNSNFNSLINAMSQHEDCAISFQLFPTNMSPEEAYMINEVSSELSAISNGTMINGQPYKDVLAKEPCKTYTYYNERRNSPIFLYNILVFGERSVCASLATKLISHLQSGTNPIGHYDPICLDLSPEGIHLPEQFSFYAWNVNQRLLNYYRNQTILQSVPLASNLFRLSRMITSEEAASFFRLPFFEKSIPALAENQTQSVSNQFVEDVVSVDNIKFGSLISNINKNVEIGCPEKIFSKHMLVVGTPGSGKTTFSINLLLQFANRNIPFLAIEPTKAEYRALIDAVPGIQIFTPGNNAVSPFLINPFIPPKGIKIEQYVPSLASAFNAAFSMPSPLDMLFIKAIRTAYNRYGWKDYSMYGDEDVTVFGLYDFIRVFKELVEKTGYVGEVKSNIESAGLLRLMNLIEQNSNIYDTINTVPIEDLLCKPSVLELNSIENAEQKSLIIALLLINICTYTKHNHISDGTLKNIILIDEAHVLLGEKSSHNRGEHSADAQGTTIKAIQDMIAEIRSYGTGIIIADQSPTKVSREVVANTDIKVSFRLVQKDEKKLIAESTNMGDEEQDNLTRLRSGEAYVFYSLLDVPQYIKTEDIREKEGIRLSVSDEEVGNKNTYWKEHWDLLKPYRECKYCESCKEGCNFKLRADAEYLASKIYERFEKNIVSTDAVKKIIYNLPVITKEDNSLYSDEDRKRVEICSRIKLYRKIILSKPYELKKELLEFVLTEYPVEKT